jgi:hypothetical protein
MEVLHEMKQSDAVSLPQLAFPLPENMEQVRRLIRSVL